MEAIKTRELLDQLDHWSQKRFRKFVASPYVNTDERLGRILDLLLGSDTPPSRAQLHAVACPELAFDYDRINNFLSYLNQLLEEFLAHEYLRAHPQWLALASLRQSRNVGLEEGLRKQIRRQQRTESQAVPTEADLLHEYLLTHEISQHRLSKQPADSSHLWPSIQALDQFYVLAMLKQACQWHHLPSALGAPPQRINDCLTLARERATQYLDHPLVRAYYHALPLLEPADQPAHYQAFKATLSELGHSLDPHELAPLCQYAQAYCVQQIEQGDASYQQELMGWYQAMLSWGCFSQAVGVSAETLRPMVALGVELGQFAWTERLIDAYAAQLDPTPCETALAYSRALLLYGQGQLPEALLRLRGMPLGHSEEALAAQRLLLQICYEQGDHGALKGHLQAFEQALRTNRLVAPMQRRRYLSLLQFVGKLDQFRIRAMTYSPQQRAQQIAKFRRSLTSRRDVISLEWLLSQVAKLGQVAGTECGASGPS
jgi:hypothetical protein